MSTEDLVDRTPTPANPARRRSLRVLLAAGVAPLAASIGCSRRASFSCAEAPSLTPAEQTLRATLGYTDRLGDPNRACDRCSHFTSAGDAACGACRLVRGPIHPRGTCNVFAPRT